MNRKLTGRGLGGVALAAAAALALSACGGGRSSSDGSTTLKLVVSGLTARAVK